jgi:hypothetical protein
VSFLLSDSLIDVIDESSLEDDQDQMGNIKILDRTYEIDSFITDGKTFRLHVLASKSFALELAASGIGSDAIVTLGENVQKKKCKIQQVGIERLPHGDRVVLGVIVRDK